MSSVVNRPRQFIRLSSHELTESGELIAVPENERVFGFLDPSKIYAVFEYRDREGRLAGSEIYSEDQNSESPKPLATVLESPEEVLQLMGVSIISADQVAVAPETSNPKILSDSRRFIRVRCVRFLLEPGYGEFVLLDPASIGIMRDMPVRPEVAAILGKPRCVSLALRSNRQDLSHYLSVYVMESIEEILAMIELASGASQN